MAILKNYGFFLISFVIFIASLIYLVFYKETYGATDYLLLLFSSSLFLLGLFGWLLNVISEIRKEIKRHKSFLSFLYDFFSSLKLALFIMIFLAILSTLGSTYIKQNQPFGFYLDRYGYYKGLWIWKLYLNDVFHSWYYILSLVVLALNLTLCSIKRLPSVWKQTFSKRRAMKLDENLEKSLETYTFKIKGSYQDLIELLRRMGFKVFMERERGKTYLYGEKGRFSRLGVYVVHLSLLIIMGGALIDALFGVRGMVFVEENSATDLMEDLSGQKTYKLPFAIKLLNFRIVTYGEEAPQFKDAVKSYESDIEIIRGDRVVARGTTKVNEPFDYKGWRIFQTSYGLTGFAKEVLLLIYDKNTKEFLGKVRLKVNEVSSYKGMLLSIDRTILNINRPNAPPNSIQTLAPAVVIKVAYKDKFYDVPVVFDPQLTMLAYSQMKDLKDFPYIFLMGDFKPQYFSGLQITKHPATPIIWLGSILMTFGLFLAFYTVHRKVWIRVEGKRVVLALYSHKFKEEFRRKILKEVERL